MSILSHPLRDKALKGFQWNLIAQAAIYIIALAGTVMMTRLLSPGEVGLFGMIMVFSSFANLLIGFGLTHAIVQNQELEEADLSSIFWLSLFIGIVVAVAFIFCAPPIARFYHQPELVDIARAFSLIFIVNSIGTVPLGILSKKMQFKALAFSQLMAAAASYTLGVALAWFGFGVWSLVAQAFCNYFLYGVANFYFARWRPLLLMRRTAFEKIFKFTRNLLPSQLLDFLASNFDLILVGRFFGKVELGIYGRATALLQLPVNSIGMIFNKTFFPVFAALQHNPEALTASYLRTTRFLTLALLPMLVFTAVAAEKIVFFLFGREWLDMAPLAFWLVWAAVLGMYNNFNDSVITSQGRTALLLRINAADKVVLIAAMLIGLQFGLMGMVYGKIGAMAVMFFPKLWAVFVVLRSRTILWATVQTRLFLSVLIAGVAVFGVNQVTGHGFGSLLLIAAVGYGTLAVTLMGLREPTWSEGVSVLRKMLWKTEN